MNSIQSQNLFTPRAPARQATPPQPRPAPATITVEELLHFKRSERPAPEYWADFEKQLKHRQLAAAIQEKRSWRHALPEMLRIALVIPAGAAAALAVGLIVWRNSSAPNAIPPATISASAEKIDTASVIAETNQPAVPVAPASPTAAETTPAGDSTEAKVAVATTQPVSKMETIARNATTDESAPAMGLPNAAISEFALAALKGVRPAAAKSIQSSTLLSMPVLVINLPVVAPVADAEKNSRATSDTAPAATETPVAKIDDAAINPRHQRLLSYIDATVAPATATEDNQRAMRARSRVTSRLNDKVVTDSISRFDATGDSLSIKF